MDVASLPFLDEPRKYHGQHTHSLDMIGDEFKPQEDMEGRRRGAIQ
jgi:hypothetical protein